MAYMKGCNPLTQQNRGEALELLYFKDGRHMPDHPYHSRYTGLWQSYHDMPCQDSDTFISTESC